jgi:hypothetical protein
MKRLLSIIISLALGLTLAPVGATALPAVVPAAESVGSTIDAPSAELTGSDDRKKKCRQFCVQSTLPEAELETFFVNDNRHLVTVNQDSITLRNLDTRSIVDTVTAPEGYRFFRAAGSSDGEEIYVLATDDVSASRVYRVDTLTLDLENVTPVLPSYPIGGYEFAVVPDHSGFLATAVNDVWKYLCRYSETGTEVGCSEHFSGSGQITSQIHFNSSNQFAYLVGADDKLVTFTLADMSFTRDTLAELNTVNFHYSASMDYGSIYLAENYGESNAAVTRVFNVSTISKTVEDTLEIPGRVNIYDVLAVPWGFYVLGQTCKSNGRPQKYSSVFVVETGAGFAVKYTIKVPNVRRGGASVTTLSRDLNTNYVLASGDGVPTSVIPNEGAFIDNTAEYICGTSWTIRWNYQNLQPGKSVKFYDIYLQRAGSGDWVKSASVNAGGEHVYELRGASVGQQLKVLPRKVKYRSYRPIDLETVAPGIPQPRVRQPRC